MLEYPRRFVDHINADWSAAITDRTCIEVWDPTDVTRTSSKDKWRKLGVLRWVFLKFTSGAGFSFSSRLLLGGRAVDLGYSFCVNWIRFVPRARVTNRSPILI